MEAYGSLYLFVEAPQGSVGCGKIILLIVQIIVHEPHVVLLTDVVIVVGFSHKRKHDILVEFILFAHDGIVIPPSR